MPHQSYQYICLFVLPIWQPCNLFIYLIVHNRLIHLSHPSISPPPPPKLLIHPSIHSYFSLSIRPAIFLTIFPSIHPSRPLSIQITQLINLPIYQPTILTYIRLTHLFTHPLVNWSKSSMYSIAKPSVHPSIN